MADTSNVLSVRPGYTFSVVAGLGGDSIRPWFSNLQENPWWAVTVSSTVFPLDIDSRIMELMAH